MKTTALDFMPARTASAIGCAPSGGAIGEASPPEGTGASRSAAEMQDTATLQLLAEEFSVTKKTVVTGRVRVATRTRNHEAFLDETLARNSVEISAIPMGEFIDAPPQVRMEGDVTIVPVVEVDLTSTAASQKNGKPSFAFGTAVKPAALGSAA